MKITQAFTPADPAEWRAWLEKNHQTEREIWLVYFKPASGRTNIDYETSVEEALCFGWIDSVVQKIDENKYVRKFNPRRSNSQWSETNKKRVLQVIRQGRMTAAGMAKVTFMVEEVSLHSAAKKKASMAIPEKVYHALQADPKVWAAFQDMAPSHRRNYLLWLADAKKAETFARRMQTVRKDLLSGKPTSMH